MRDPAMRPTPFQAYVRIMIGCDKFCTYCIVPAVRGASQSQRAVDIEKQLAHLADKGFGEVVLSGVHLGRWGEDLSREGQDAGQSLETLLLRLRRLALPLRYRLSSIEPLEFTDRLIEVISGFEAVAHHFHLPMQSGSDAVLMAMKRPYTAEQYGERVEAICSALPDSCIGADVMVGFPGESEADDQATVSFVEGQGLTYLHVFPFSPRPGTPAAQMAGRPHGDLAKERSRRLRRISERKRREFAERFVGTEQQLVVLSVDRDSGDAVGLSGNYLQVVFPAMGVRRGQLVQSRILTAGEERLQGELVL